MCPKCLITPSPWLREQTLLMTLADAALASAALTFWTNVFPDIAKSVILSDPYSATNQFDLLLLEDFLYTQISTGSLICTKRLLFTCIKTFTWLTRIFFVKLEKQFKLSFLNFVFGRYIQVENFICFFIIFIQRFLNLCNVWWCKYCSTLCNNVRFNSQLISWTRLWESFILATSDAIYVVFMWRGLTKTQVYARKLQWPDGYACVSSTIFNPVHLWISLILGPTVRVGPKLPP